MQGLMEARRRNPSNIAMTNLIDQYIILQVRRQHNSLNIATDLSLQFNAIQENALIGNINGYKISWMSGRAPVMPWWRDVGLIPFLRRG